MASTGGTVVRGVKGIHIFKWVMRIIAIVAVLIGIAIGSQGSWGDALYAIFLGIITWAWSNRLAERLAKNQKLRQAGQGRQPSQDR